MAIKLGREASIKKNDVLIAHMKSFSLTINNGTIDVAEFGTEWAKFKRGMQSWTAQISGYYDRESTEQTALTEAARLGTEINDLSFYVDATSNFFIDTVTDVEACCIVASFTITADNGSVVAFDMQVTGSGPIDYFPSA
jgi:hypothetical protein